MSVFMVLNILLFGGGQLTAGGFGVMVDDGRLREFGDFRGFWQGDGFGV